MGPALAITERINFTLPHEIIWNSYFQVFLNGFKHICHTVLVDQRQNNRLGR